MLAFYRGLLIVLLTGVVVSACNQRPAPQCPDQERKITMIVLHATGGFACVNNQWRQFPGGNLQSMRKHFIRNQHKVSIHFLVGRNGQVLSMLPVTQIAAHTYGYNRQSIGIELVNDGDGIDPYPPAQQRALHKLLKKLLRQYRLSGNSIYRHSELDRRVVVCAGKTYPRRSDPGKQLPDLHYNR